MTLLLLLMAANFLVGCQTWRPWHKKSADVPIDSEVSEENSEAKSYMESVTEEVSGFSKAFRGGGGDSGTGLSDRSRDIERRLGYK